MSIRFFKVLVILFTINFNSVAQLWPIMQDDDPSRYFILNGTLGEIHDTGGDHFHEGIDIDCNNDSIPIRPISDGEVAAVFSSSVTIRHDFQNGDWQKQSKYLHINPNVNTDSIVVAGQTILGYVDGVGYNTHLHLEMRVWNGSDWIIVNPVNNNSGWQLNLPTGHADGYAPQINDILIEALNNQNNNVPSGFDVIDPNNNNGAVTFHTDYLKVHMNSTTPHSTLSTGTQYNYPTEKIVVWGNIGFVVNARDVGVNSAPGSGLSSGEGLTVTNIGYSYIDQNNNAFEKYIVDFSDFLDAETDQIGQFFHIPYFNPEQMPNHYLYGNHDFIELRSTNNTYLHIHQQINGIQSNGVWFTKADKNTNHVFNQTPGQAQIADANEFALYSDGEQTLNFFVSDAAGQEANEDLDLIVDNFIPFIKEVEIYDDWNLITPVYEGEWEWQNGQYVFSAVQANSITQDEDI
ncbi:MAG: hypothetical protein B6I19_05035 [Bacteroidetes bacterium 4572_114]|nr:MAG: hypothetical protein B6I19_05035 [Bacteroidetes bacterium 4572_114]